MKRLALLIGSALLATPAFSADLVQYEDVSYTTTSPSILPWEGLYAGVFGGFLGGDGRAELSDYAGPLMIGNGTTFRGDIANGLFPQEIEDWNAGLIGGVAVGFNAQFDSLVVGLEFDAAITDLSMDHRFERFDPNPDPVFNGARTVSGYSTDVDGLLTGRARLGYAFDPLLVYATGGFATGQVENAFSLSVTNFPFLNYPNQPGNIGRWSDNGWKWGYTVGGGAEMKVSDRIGLKAEALYVDLEDTEIVATDPAAFGANRLNYEFDNSFVVGKLGVNFLF